MKAAPLKFTRQFAGVHWLSIQQPDSHDKTQEGPCTLVLTSITCFSRPTQSQSVFLCSDCFSNCMQTPHPPQLCAVPKKSVAHDWIYCVWSSESFTFTSQQVFATAWQWPFQFSANFAQPRISKSLTELCCVYWLKGGSSLFKVNKVPWALQSQRENSHKKWQKYCKNSY